jgi:hypothetical protein
MKRITVFLALPQYRALSQMARAHGLTFAEMLRRALDHFLHTVKEPPDVSTPHC